MYKSTTSQATLVFGKEEEKMACTVLVKTEQQFCQILWKHCSDKILSQCVFLNFHPASIDSLTSTWIQKNHKVSLSVLWVIYTQWVYMMHQNPNGRLSKSFSLIDCSVTGETLKCFSTNDSVAQQQWTQCDDRKGFRTCFTKYNMSEFNFHF